jgi:hypothetical protein
VEQVTDAAVTASPWGGLARKLPDGDWVITFGGTQTAAEYDSSGNRVFTWQLAPGGGLYRVTPVLPGVLSRDALRAGMDAQYPVP